MSAGWRPWEGLCGTGTVLLALNAPTQCAAGWLDSAGWDVWQGHS